MGDLAGHVGGVLARTTLICRLLPTERPSAPRPPEGVDPAAWCLASLEEMLVALGESDPATPVWGLWPDSSIGLWEQRMVIETGLHRWDADQAFGEVRALTGTVAQAALDEYAAMWLPRLGEVPAIEVVADDLDRHWVYGEGTPTATVGGTASDIYLRLMSRPSPVTLPAAWALAVDSLEPPRKST
jgi:uncharacterized protein (TIGR03083 family)